MKKIFLILLLASLPALGAIEDGKPRFNWEPPTEFTDGSPLDAANDLESYRIICAGAAVVDFTVPPDTVTYLSQQGQFVPGDYTCVMRSVATGGVESADSESVNFTVPQPAPLAPAGFSVN